jgi:hypothetical protein
MLLRAAEGAATQAVPSNHAFAVQLQQQAVLPPQLMVLQNLLLQDLSDK